MLFITGLYGEIWTKVMEAAPKWAIDALVAVIEAEKYWIRKLSTSIPPTKPKNITQEEVVYQPGCGLPFSSWHYSWLQPWVSRKCLMKLVILQELCHTNM